MGIRKIVLKIIMITKNIKLNPFFFPVLLFDLLSNPTVI